MLTQSGDPWSRTVSLLTVDANTMVHLTGSVAKDVPPRVATNPTQVLRCALVRLIDRPTATTAIVAWSDPTSCFYGDQKWCAGIARHQGICAISGRPIRRGDKIFKPYHRPVPANAMAMILAAVLREANET